MFIIILYVREKTRVKFRKNRFFLHFQVIIEDILPKAVFQKIIRINLLMLFFYYYLSKNYLNLLGFIKIRGSESRQVHVYSTKLISFNKII